MNIEESCPPPHAAQEICDDSLGAELGAMAKKLKKNKMVSLVAGSVTVAAAAMFCLDSLEISAGLLWLCIVIAGIGFVVSIICAANMNWYSKEIKRRAGYAVTMDELGKVFELTLFHPNDYINELKCRAARMRIDWDKMTGCGYISGKYQGIEFEFSNVELIIVNESKKSGADKTIFVGPWLIVNLAVPVQSPVIVSTRSVGTSTPGATRGMADVKTENAAFNQKFVIKAFDMLTAFYVLTPTVIECIMEVDRMVSGYKHFSFERNHMHVVLGTGYVSFQVLNDANNIPALRERIQNEIRSLAVFMDMLFLNDRLFEH